MIGLYAQLAHFQHEVYGNAVAKGWYESPEPVGTRIALIHSELSELLETYREGSDKDQSQKIIGYTNAEEELADVVIRALDFAQAQGMDLAGAMIAKHEYNKTRSYKHGGKKF